MVYDPIRDCDMPSPAMPRRASLWDNPAPPQPPAFSDSVPQSSARPMSSVSGYSGAGSLRSLLNDDSGAQGTSRRGSDMTVSSHEDPEQGGTTRPHLSKLLNNDASPLVRTTSASSSSRERRETSSPRLSSPSIGLHPASAGGPAGRSSRSPLLHNQSLGSPSTSMGYPYDAQTTPGASTGGPGGYGGPSSRRSSMDVSMPPPADPVRQHDIYSTPVAQTAQLRSPSVSVSPRQQNMHLPSHGSHPTSRHSSARPNSSGSAFQPRTTSSPEPRRLSNDSSIVASPVSLRTPYDPVHPSRTPTFRRPISKEELAQLRSSAMNNNPLRKKMRRSAPQWSAPSPRASVHEYGDDAGPSRSAGPSRRGSTASASAERPRPPSRENSSGKRRAQEDPERNQRRRLEYSGVAGEVASHYNSRPEVGVEHREFSPIIGLKKFNNWVKSVLIGKFTERPRNGPGAKVLDIGCGKGGDLNKWRQARISLYVGMDIAATSIDQARDRWNTMRGNRFDAYFYAHDCYGKPISDVLPDYLQREQYTNVSMQFCMHYAFENAQKARMMIENVSRYLRRGGMFVGTIPNSQLLLERLDAIPEGEELRFGNSCYTISFNERRHKGVYGHEYRFYLEDAVEDVPEYIVDWDNFVNLAGEYGLELVYRKTFSDVLQEEQSSRDFGPLLGKMGVINEHGESAMDSDQWEAANIYMAFAFEKVR